MLSHKLGDGPTQCDHSADTTTGSPQKPSLVGGAVGSKDEYSLPSEHGGSPCFRLCVVLIGVRLGMLIFAIA